MAALTIMLAGAVSVESAQKNKGAFDAAIERGDYAAAAGIAQAAVAKLKPEPDVRDPQVRSALLDQARMAVWQARWEDAERHLSALEARMRKVLSADDAGWVPVLRKHGQLESGLYEFAAADRLLGEARRIAALGNTPPAETAELLQTAADSLTAQLRWWEATLVRKEQIELLEKLKGSDSLEVAEALVDLAPLLDSPYPPRFTERKAALARAEKILDAAYREGKSRGRKVDRLATLAALVRWLDESGGLHDLETWDDCAVRKERVTATEREFGANSALLIHPLAQYASLCELDLEASEIGALFERALAIARATWGAHHPDVIYVLEQQGAYYASSEGSASPARGDRILQEAAREKAFVYPRRGTLLAAHWLLDLTAVDNFECSPFDSAGCVESLRKNLATLERNWGGAHPALAEVRAHVAATLGERSASYESQAARAQRYAFVEEQFGLALDADRAQLGELHPQTARIANDFASYMGSVRCTYWKAAQLQELVLASYRKELGRHDPATREAEKSLAWWRSGSDRGPC
jgi:hypothetical protein